MSHNASLIAWRFLVSQHNGTKHLGTADNGDIESDLPELLISLAEAAGSRKTGVAIFIDEMQYLAEREFAAIIASLHRISQMQLPLILIGAGLPQLLGLAGNAKSYSERLFDFPRIGPLDAEDARTALQKPVMQEGISFDELALDEIVNLTEGYPYFLQTWGYRAWDAAAASPITLEDIKRCTPDVLKSLDHNFFLVRLDRLKPSEKKISSRHGRNGVRPSSFRRYC